MRHTGVANFKLWTKTFVVHACCIRVKTTSYMIMLYWDWKKCLAGSYDSNMKDLSHPQVRSRRHRRCFVRWKPTPEVQLFMSFIYSVTLFYIVLGIPRGFSTNQYVCLYIYIYIYIHIYVGYTCICALACFWGDRASWRQPWFAPRS